ncbi:MAG: hypothetical protein D6678_08175 [Zetaproteobacteria bacterium]|nr:MAG: hypothetical protein D6678_08175 [Zetaproteobacteria bacterium]
MTDEFSIRENEERKRRLRRQAEEELLPDHGAAEWAVPEQRAEKKRVEPATPAPEESSNEPEMPFPMLPGMGEEEEESKPSSLDIMRLLRGVWNRKWMIVLLALGLTVLFAVLAKLKAHPTWTASALLIKKEHVDRFRIGGGKEFKFQKYDLKTMLDTLKLGTVLEDAARRVGEGVRAGAIGGALTVASSDETQMITLRVTWDDPEMAAKIVNSVADAFLDYNRKMRQREAREVYDKYSRQYDETRQKMADLLTEFQRFQQQFGVVSFSGEMDELIKKSLEVELDYKEALAEVAALREAKARLDKTIAAMPERVVKFARYSNALKKRLAEAQLELEQALGRYTAKNPKILELQDRIARLKQAIAEGGDKMAPENIYEPNPLRKDLIVKRFKLIDKLKLAEAKLASLSQTNREIHDKLRQLGSKKKGFLDLETRREALRRTQDHLLNRMQEVKVFVDQGETDFELVEPAKPPTSPNPTKGKLLIVAGGVVGSLLGILLALVLEFRDPRLLTRREAIGLTEVEHVFELQQVPEEESAVVDARRPNAPVASVFRKLLNDLEALLEDVNWQSLAVISVEPEAGRSLLAANLAQAMSMKERSCLLVDADLRVETGARPGKLLGLPPAAYPGLVELLAGRASLSRCLVRVPGTYVRLMPPVRGEPERGSLNWLGRRRMYETIERLRRFEGHVLYDLPPLQSDEVAIEAARAISHALLIVRSGQSIKQDVQAMAERLRVMGIKVHAVLLTDVPVQLLAGPPQFEVRKERKRKRWSKRRG